MDVSLHCLLMLEIFLITFTSSGRINSDIVSFTLIFSDNFFDDVCILEFCQFLNLIPGLVCFI